MGESPANTSFHLRQLAKYGFVEEAEGGTGRRRPWKLKHLGMRLTDVHADPETAGAARELDRVPAIATSPRAERALEERHAQPDDGARSPGMNQMRLYLTPDELEGRSTRRSSSSLLDRFGDRRLRHRSQPEDAERVEILTFAYRV